MPEHPGAGRLDAETLAAYVDGQLPPEQRARVEAELAADPENYDWMVNTVSAVDDAVIPAAIDRTGDGGESPGRVLPFFRRPVVRGVVGSLLAAAAALVLVVRTQPVWWQNLRGPSVDPRFAKLVEAVGEERYIEARLTGGFKYGPLRQVMRGPGDLSSQNLQLLAAAGELQKAAAAGPSAENLHVLGTSYVLLGDLTNGISALERAENANGADATLLTDLAAAYATRAARDGRADDWPRALDAAQRALDLTPELAEAQFNRAIVLEHLGLRAKALEAWRLYLSASPDPDPGWAEEARRRLDALAGADEGPSPRGAFEGLSPLEESPTRVAAAVTGVSSWAIRRFVETRVLAEWAVQVVANPQAPVPGILQWLGRPGAADATLAELSRRASHACGRDRTSCRTFADAHAALASAAAHQAQERYLDSLAAAERASIGLESVSSPMVDAARLLHARALIRAGRRDDGRSILAAIRATGHNPLALAGAVAQEGILAFTAGDLRETARLYGEYRAFADRSGDGPSRLMARAMLGTYARYLGDAALTWRHWAEAATVSQGADPRARHAWLIGMVNACYDAGLLRAGLTISDELEANAARVHPSAEVEAHAIAGRLLATLGRPDDARRALARARTALALVDDEALRVRIELQVLTAEAETLADAEALTASARAIDIVERSGENLRLAQLRLLESRAARRAGDRLRSDAALRAGLERFEHERAQLQADGRLTYTDQSWGLLADQASNALESGNLGQGFAAIQQSRARTLDEMRRESRRAWTLADVRAGLPPDRAVLLMAQFDQRLALLTITSALQELEWVQVSRPAAQQLAHRLTGDAPARSDLAEAYDRLLQPAAQHLHGIDTLVIVPDVPYHSVPFPALVDRRRGHYLIEDFAVVLAPSVGIALGNAEASGTPRSALAIGVGRSEQGLPALQVAADEARRVGKLYAVNNTLVDVEATPERVLHGLASADVVHIASHAVANEDRPMLSHLQLHAVEPDAGLLFASELQSLRLDHVRVAVLAACGTAKGTIRRGEGPLSLARAMLGAGVHNVVATLTDVPDAASSGLYVKFHQMLASGRDVAHALRDAQLEAIERGDDDGAWTRMVVVGSGW